MQPENETLNKFKATVSLLPRFGRNKINNPTTLENEHVNVSVLVYTFSRMFKDGLRDLMFEGNLREECNLQFDCTFKQKFNHQVTPKLFYSMDAVLVGNEAVNFLKKVFPLAFCDLTSSRSK
ncbi:uncharacterized protein LOC142350253 isoform X2 [Convolutriloba macropyga]|uniref:uncharacterized protein LOC142350253 isoform X2 n=1 Tax=Convolutriloba macropyga TaxID=536237 RepID=UPI003F525C84